MKWRSYKIGQLKVAIGELRSIHTCNSRDPNHPGTAVIGTYLSVYWRGSEKLAQVLKLDVQRTRE